MPFSRTLPRGDSKAARGGEPLAERNQIVLVPAGAVQEQQRLAAVVARRDEAMDESEIGFLFAHDRSNKMGAADAAPFDCLCYCAAAQVRGCGTIRI